MRLTNLAPDRLPNARQSSRPRPSPMSSPTENPTSVLASLYDLDGWAGRSTDLIAELEETGTEHYPRPTCRRLRPRRLRASASSRIRFCPRTRTGGMAGQHLRTAYSSYLGDYRAGLRILPPPRDVRWSVPRVEGHGPTMTP